MPLLVPACHDDTYTFCKGDTRSWIRTSAVLILSQLPLPLGYTGERAKVALVVQSNELSRV